MEKKKRNSNIEMLRIIAMLMIIAYHYMYHGFGGKFNYTSNQYLIQIVKIGGALGVDIFFIITGYYMYKSKLTIKKLLKLEGEVLFYSILIPLSINILFKNTNIFKVVSFKAMFFPNLSNVYWFSTAYIILVILSQYINQFIEYMDMKSTKRLLLILLVFEFIVPTCFGRGTSLLSLDKVITLYLIGAYIQKYNLAKNHTVYIRKILMYSIIQIGIVIFLVYIKHLEGKAIIIKYVCHENPITLLIAIYMFLLAISLPSKSNKIINALASTTFGIYLLQEYPLMKTIIWNILINCAGYYDKPEMLINCIGTAILIFIVFSIIDFIRINTVEKLYMKIVDKLIDKISKLKSKKLLRIELT